MTHRKEKNISSWNIIPKTVIVAGIVLEEKIYDGRTDVNVRSVSFGGLANRRYSGVKGLFCSSRI